MTIIGSGCPASVEGGLYGNQSGDRSVYYFIGGALHSVADPPTLQALGLTFDMVQWIDPLCLALMAQGAPFPSIQSGGYGPVAQALQAFRAGSQVYPTGYSPISSYPTPTPPASGSSGSAPTSGGGVLGGLSGSLATIEGDVKAHEKALLLGGAALLAWKMGLFGALFKRRRY